MTGINVEAYLGLIVQACNFVKYLDHINIQAYTPNNQRPVFCKDDLLKITLWEEEGAAVHLGIDEHLWRMLSPHVDRIPGQIIKVTLIRPGRLVVFIAVS